MPIDYRKASDESGNILAFQPEGGVKPGEAELPWINMTWGYWFPLDYLLEQKKWLAAPGKEIPLVSKYKWLEPRHMVNICNRWEHYRNSDIQHAFFNGTGYESWESIWCIWNGITPRDGEALRRTATIMRAYSDLLVSKDWEPHTPTLQKGIYASRFPGEQQTIWTLINRNTYQVDGPQLRVPIQSRRPLFRPLAWCGTEARAGWSGGGAEFRARRKRLWLGAGSKRRPRPEIEYSACQDE